MTPWLLLTVVGCTGSPSGTSDSRLYLEAQATGDPVLCEQISESGLRGECFAHAGRERAEAGDAAGGQDVCRSMVAGPWRDECFFLVADASGAVGDEAKRLCAESGQFRQQCVGHAISRDVATLFAVSERGAEAQLLDDVEARIGTYIGGGEVKQKARRLVAAELSARDPEVPFGRAQCGTVGDRVCTDAYVERIKRAAKLINPEEVTSDWRRACGSTVDPGNVAELGLPAWDPDIDELAQKAWARVCVSRKGKR